MPHPLVDQLRFARSEFVRSLHGVTLQESYVQLGQMNCISWTIGHMASQENSYFVLFAQGKTLLPGLRDLVGGGSQATTPKLDDMWAAWREATANADEFLDTVTTESLQTHFDYKGKQISESVGTLILRTTYHYWFHLGNCYAIREQLGHKKLPEFVGGMSSALYRPE